jgi:hypothetical protein
MTLAELEHMLTVTTAAQSMLLAAVLRPLIASGAVSEDALVVSLAEKERAAMERGTLETGALTGLIDLLRRDLGLSEGTRPAVS